MTDLCASAMLSIAKIDSISETTAIRNMGRGITYFYGIAIALVFFISPTASFAAGTAAKKNRITWLVHYDNPNILRSFIC